MSSIAAAASWRGCASSLVVVSILLLALGCGDRQGSSGDASNVPRAAPPTSASPNIGEASSAPVSRVPRRLRVRFPILRSRPEKVPQDVRAVIRTPSLGMNMDLAQRIPVGVVGNYWLVPARGYLCVLHYGSLGISAAGMNCTRPADAVANGVANVAIGPEAPGSRRQVRLIVGMTPRGSREVVVRTRGSTATARVENDIFVIRDSLIAPPDSITVR